MDFRLRGNDKVIGSPVLSFPRRRKSNIYVPGTLKVPGTFALIGYYLTDDHSSGDREYAHASIAKGKGCQTGSSRGKAKKASPPLEKIAEDSGLESYRN